MIGCLIPVCHLDATGSKPGSVIVVPRRESPVAVIAVNHGAPSYVTRCGATEGLATSSDRVLFMFARLVAERASRVLTRRARREFVS